MSEPRKTARVDSGKERVTVIGETERYCTVETGQEYTWGHYRGIVPKDWLTDRRPETPIHAGNADRWVGRVVMVQIGGDAWFPRMLVSHDAVNEYVRASDRVNYDYRYVRPLTDDEIAPREE